MILIASENTKSGDAENFAEASTRQKKRGELPPDGTEVKFERNEVDHLGKIENRKIVMRGNHNGVYTSFSRAASSIAGSSLNGLECFYIQLPSEQGWVLAKHWRDSPK